MCRRIECPKCKKSTYAGCGLHVEQVLGDVPHEERCTCHDAPKKDTTVATSVLARILGL